MKKRVLLVDDEEDTRNLTKRLLSDYDCHCVNDGRGCLKRIKKEGFDLILMDIMMPGPNPKEVVSQIPSVPTCATSKIAYFSVVEQSEKSKKELLSQKNVVDYIQKPIPNAAFVERIRKLLED